MKYDISGFLNVNKPEGCTSHDIVLKLRKSLGIKKIGHSGTLDPFASGVLVTGINEATRLFEYLSSDKTYLAEITFGLSTNTDDITGKITGTTENIPTLREIKKKINLFCGKIKQKPPLFSAVNVEGERAYKLARKDKISLDKLNEKIIEIYSFDILSYENKKLKVKIHASAGTYIRSIARDLGKELQSLAILSSLERTKAGKFTISESINPNLIDSSSLAKYLISPVKVLELEKMHITEEQVKDILFGRQIKIKTSVKTNQLQLLDPNGNLIAVGEVINEDFVRPKKVFVKNES